MKSPTLVRIDCSIKFVKKMTDLTGYYLVLRY